ncbi:hypothetical protein SCL_1059 [Sulfuricaulis limicola]|uniref:Uncharacterized protein n=1 Tax=Sulfuricaulis limicola TaxID=1620215 RepID=A0A1B4XEZ2_9GAMM|nr:hypothetical protein SCL_1059 [Sulfuricaulis limicola]
MGLKAWNRTTCPGIWKTSSGSEPDSAGSRGTHDPGCRGGYPHTRRREIPAAKPNYT